MTGVVAQVMDGKPPSETSEVVDLIIQQLEALDSPSKHAKTPREIG